VLIVNFFISNAPTWTKLTAPLPTQLQLHLPLFYSSFATVHSPTQPCLFSAPPLDSPVTSPHGHAPPGFSTTAIPQRIHPCGERPPPPHRLHGHPRHGSCRCWRRQRSGNPGPRAHVSYVCVCRNSFKRQGWCQIQHFMRHFGSCRQEEELREAAMCHLVLPWISFHSISSYYLLDSQKKKLLSSGWPACKMAILMVILIEQLFGSFFFLRE
jgi:hypothetical protein